MADNLPTAFRPSGRIKNLPPRLIERGKIKIGRKGEVRKSSSGGEWQPPVKLDHFIVTSMERGHDNNFILDPVALKAFGEKPTELPVRLLFDEIEHNFQSRYACYQGKTLWCSGDGERACRAKQGGGTEEVTCPCPRQEPAYTGKDRCKINGTLSVMIDGVGGIGSVFKIRTTSFNSVCGISDGLDLIYGISGGVLAGLPLLLTLTPKTTADPSGKPVTVYVIGIEYRGEQDRLMQIGLERRVNAEQHKYRIAHAQEYAIKLLSGPQVGTVDADGVVEEFYPEQAEKAARENGEIASGLDRFEAAHTKSAVIDVEPAAEQSATLGASINDAVTANLAEDVTKMALLADAKGAATLGRAALTDFWQGCSADQRASIKNDMKPLGAIADEADRRRAPGVAPVVDAETGEVTQPVYDGCSDGDATAEGRP